MRAAWGFVLFTAFLSAADHPWTEIYPDEAAAANTACKAKDFASCRQHLLTLLEMLDGRADVVYKLAKTEAALGHTDAALDLLTRLSKGGLTFAKPESDSEFAALRSNASFQASLARIEAARRPITSSQPFATLPESDLIAEDIVYDPAGRRFFVSSVRHRKILSLTMDGRAADFVPEGQPDVWAILALGIDKKRGYLWASTVAMPEGAGYRPADEGRSALLRYSLASGKLLKRYDLHEGKHALGDMTVSPAGDVFVSDGNGAVYWVEHSRDALEMLVGPGTFRSPQTPALVPGGGRLLVPDYSRGIGIVDLASRRTSLLLHPPQLSLSGIDGLYLSGNTLIAIQNGTAPERVISMRLDASLTRVIDWKTIEANWPDLGDPTHGVFAGRDFYFIANSGWDKLTDDGALKAGEKFTPAVIRKMRKP